MPAVEINGVKLNYMQLHNSENTACLDVVMIHGLATNIAFWYFRHAVELSKKYRVTLYDLRGHGRSSTTIGGYTPANMSKDLQLLLDHLRIKKAHFIAHSFGGIVALKLACAEPERFGSLILVDSHIATARRQLNGTHWQFGKKLNAFLKRHNIEIDSQDPYFGYKLLNIAVELHQKNVTIDMDLKDILGPMIGHFSKRTVRQWKQLLEKTQAGRELMGDDDLSLDKLRQLTFPILAIYGENSPAMSTGQHLLDVWPHAQFYLMRGAGHFFPVTAATEFVGRCQRFIDVSRTKVVQYRLGDNGQRHFRSDRFYREKNSAWFFDTREAPREGPFGSYDEAKASFFAKLPFVKQSDALSENLHGSTVDGDPEYI